LSVSESATHRKADDSDDVNDGSESRRHIEKSEFKSTAWLYK